MLTTELLHFFQCLFNEHIVGINQSECRDINEIISEILHLERFQVERCE